ncbi:MAG: class I SAM-dependent methyltransferase [Vicinamibacterales bacterium]|jgi:SAM-dependent methyltransferase|nr:class I SAM-dependent methyltransferase [Vicinamibacterales bacterium]
MMDCPTCGKTRPRSFDLSDAIELYRCQACGLVYRGLAWTPGESVEHYEGYYAGRQTAFDPLTEKRYHEVLGQFERRVRPGRLLDVGCGLGHFLVVGEARGWQSVGLEVSASGVGLLERLKADRGLDFQIVTQPLLEADLQPGSFRAITMFEVIEHLSDPQLHLERIHNLLEPGGILYLTTPNFDSLSRLALGGGWRAMTPDHLCLFNPRALRASLRAAGFQPELLTSKNVDLPEILAKWRRGPSSGRSVETSAATQSCRNRVERSSWLRAVKATANVGLHLFGRGDTLEAMVLKDASAAA